MTARGYVCILVYFVICLSTVSTLTHIDLSNLEHTTTLYLHGSPYYVEGTSAVVLQNLIIHPGVQLYFNAGFELTFTKSIFAVGAEEDRISFVVNNNNSVCHGGSDSDVSGKIVFSATSKSQLYFVDICFASFIKFEGGVLHAVGEVSIEYGSLSFENVKEPLTVESICILDSPGIGLQISSRIGVVTLTDSSIKNSQGVGLAYAFSEVDLQAPETSYTEFCRLGQSAGAKEVTDPLFVRFTPFGRHPCKKVFRARPGEVILMVFKNGLPVINLDIYDGESSSDPVIWSRSSWDIHRREMVSSGEKLYVNIHHDSWTTTYFIVYSVPKGGFDIRSSQIEGSGGPGIEISGLSKLSVSDSAVISNQGHGITLDKTSNAEVTITGCRIFDNHGTGIIVHNAQEEINVVRSHFTSNTLGALLLSEANNRILIDSNEFDRNKVNIQRSVVAVTGSNRGGQIDIVNNRFADNSPSSVVGKREVHCSQATTSVLSVNGPLQLKMEKNAFRNPLLQTELLVRIPSTRLKYLDLGYNYWGSDDEVAIRKRIRDGRQQPFYSVANFYPFYKSVVLSQENLVGIAEEFSHLDPFHGGPVFDRVFLSQEFSPFIIHYEIVINHGGVLEIEPGTVLRFNTGVGLSVFGQLIAVGEPSRWIRFEHSGQQTQSCFHSYDRGWGGIKFMTSDDAKSDLAYVHIDGVTYSFLHTPPSPASAIQIYGETPDLDILTITNSKYGIFLLKSKCPSTFRNIYMNSRTSGQSIAAEMINDVTWKNITTYKSSVCVYGFDQLYSSLLKFKFRYAGSFSFCYSNENSIHVSPTQPLSFDSHVALAQNCKRTFVTDADNVLRVKTNSIGCLDSIDVFEETRITPIGSFISEGSTASIRINSACNEESIERLTIEAVPILYRTCPFNFDFCEWMEDRPKFDIPGSQDGDERWELKGSYACAGSCPESYDSTNSGRVTGISLTSSTLSVSSGTKLYLLESHMIRPIDNVCAIKFNYVDGRTNGISLRLIAKFSDDQYVQLGKAFAKYKWTTVEVNLAEMAVLKGKTFSLSLLAVQASFAQDAGIGIDNVALVQCPGTIQRIVVENSYFKNVKRGLDINSLENKKVVCQNNVFELEDGHYGNSIVTKLGPANLLFVNNLIMGDYYGISLSQSSGTIVFVHNNIKDGGSLRALKIVNTGNSDDVSTLMRGNIIEKNKHGRYMIELRYVTSTFKGNYIHGNGGERSYNLFYIYGSGKQAHVFEDNVILSNVPGSGRSSGSRKHATFKFERASAELSNNIIMNPAMPLEAFWPSTRSLNVNAQNNWWGETTDETVSARFTIDNNEDYFQFKPYLKTPPNHFSFGQPQCPIGWHHLSDTCLAIVFGARTSNEATGACQAIGGHLLSYEKAEELVVPLGSLTSYTDMEDETRYTSVWVSAEEGCLVFEAVGADYELYETCDGRHAIACETLPTKPCKNQCSEHGECNGGSCLCDSGYTGDDCSSHHCEGVADCSGHGECVGPNTCLCQSGWQGSACSTSNCTRYLDCRSCTSTVGCGWCDDDDRGCFPGSPGNIDTSYQCNGWFYYRCTTVQDSQCSTEITTHECSSLYCQGPLYDKEKCTECDDFEKCFKLPNGTSCRIWDEEKCPGGIVAPDYEDPNRVVTSTDLKENVMVINPNETMIYSCPVSFGDDDPSTILIIENEFPVKIGDVILSTQSGGIIHKVGSFTVAEPYLIIRAMPANLEEIFKCADFKQETTLTPIEEDYLLESVPEDMFLKDVLDGSITFTSANNKLHILDSTDSKVFKCTGHGYAVDADGSTDYSYYLVMPSTEQTRSYTVGDILASGTSDGFLETIKRKRSSPRGLFVETEITRCTDDSELNHRITSNVQLQQFSCVGGKGVQGLHLMKESTDADSLTLGSTFAGRKSSAFVVQVAKITENNGYVFLEVIEVTDINNGQVITSIDLTSVQSGQRVKRASGSAFQKLKNFFRKTFTPDFDGKVTAKTTVRVTFTPTVKISLKINRHSPYVHKVGVAFNGKLVGHVEERIDFEGSFTVTGPKQEKYNHPINNKLIGTFSLPIWAWPVVTLPGRLVWDVTFKIVAEATVKGFISASVTATGTMDTSVTWRATSGLDFNPPKFGFSLEKKIDGELDKKKTKASLTATLTPSLKAQWPAVPELPRAVKWLIPNVILDLLGVGSGRQSISVLQVSIAAPIFLTAYAEACSQDCVEPGKTLKVGVMGGLKSVNGDLNVKAFGLQKNFPFLRFSDKRFIIGTSKCIGFILPCCLCDDGSAGLLDPGTGKCLCSCFCDPPNNTIESVMPEGGECRCEKCPDGTLKKRNSTGGLGCPCECIDGTRSELDENGKCKCNCTCDDMTTRELDVSGKCPCHCKCNNCEESTIGPNGCICPNDTCPVCEKGEPMWVDCECKCIEDYPCGVPPNCLNGRTGPYCLDPDCSDCNDCNGNGYCFGRDDECGSKCVCLPGWKGRCCQSKKPRRGWGDPHFTSLDGCRYDLHMIGEYWDCMGEEIDLGIQVRLWGRTTRKGGISFPGAVAVKAGSQTVTVVIMKDTNTVRLRIDGVEQTFGATRNTIFRLDNNNVILKVRRINNEHFRFKLAYRNGFYFTTDARLNRRSEDKRQFTNYKYTFGRPAEYFGKTRGLCGHFDNQCGRNDLTGPDGTEYTNLFDFGRSWKITSSAAGYPTWSWTASNFHPDDIMDNTYSLTDFTPKPTRPRHVFWREKREVISDIEQRAHQSCAVDLKLKDVDYDNCYDDIVLMNDTSFAEQEEFKIGICPSGCSEHGNCVDGKCQCSDGWKGDECQYSVCGVKCSNNGNCVDGFCRCTTGWEGETCDVRATCHNRSNCTDSMHGVCKETDVCQCNDGFKGPDCSQVAFCLKRNNCSGNGACVDTDVCRCNLGWKGDNCDKFSCESPRFCSGRGSCIGFDICSCDIGWTGESCNIPNCVDVGQCSGHGVCTSPNVCSCSQGYTGNSCDQLLSCPDLDDCGGNGLCYKVNETQQCKCDAGYSGLNCSAIDCTTVNHCSSHGVCTQPNVCTCDSGFTGTNCEEYSCKTMNFCSGHGKCVAFDFCKCDDGWSGVSCNVANCSLYSDCNNQGVCVEPNVCDCFPTFDGPSCGEKVGENKFDPVFDELEDVEVNDEIAVGTVVSIINASDADVGRNGKVRFSILSHVDKFTIDAAGVLKTIRALDFDDVPSRVLQVVLTAYDQGLPQRSAITSFNITGLDENDNCPVFTAYPSEAIQIAMGSSKGTFVTLVSAKDADSNLNGAVDFSLSNEGPLAQFAVKSSGNIITAVEQLMSGKFIVKVTASDSGVNPCSTSIDIEILVVIDSVFAPSASPSGSFNESSSERFSTQGLNSTTAGNIMPTTSVVSEYSTDSSIQIDDAITRATDSQRPGGNIMPTTSVVSDYNTDYSGIQKDDMPSRATASQIHGEGITAAHVAVIVPCIVAVLVTVAGVLYLMKRHFAKKNKVHDSFYGKKAWPIESLRT